MSWAALVVALAGLASAQTAAVPVTVGQSTGTIASSTAPVVGVTTTTVSLTTAPLTGSTTGLNAPTNAPGPSYTPPGAVPQGYNGPGASFVQPGVLTPQQAPGTTPNGPVPPPNPITPTNPTTTPQSAPPATATPQTTPQAAPPPATTPAPAQPTQQPAAPQSPSTIVPQRHTRAESEATRAGLEASDRRSMRTLDEENAERHRQLHEQYRARRRLLTESDDWKFSSWSERRAQLKALKKEYEEREDWLRDDYLQKREGLLKMSQGGTDDLRIQGTD